MNDMLELKVPDIGGFKNVEVIEILVAEGDEIQVGQGLITVESDKASIEIPAVQSGIVQSLKVKVGSKVSQDTSILELIETPEQGGEGDQGSPRPSEKAPAAASNDSRESSDTSRTPNDSWESSDASRTPNDSRESSNTSRIPNDSRELLGASRTSDESHQSVVARPATESRGSLSSHASVSPRLSHTNVFVNPSLLPHASPSVRKFARELGVDLSKVAGQGIKGRITKDDVQAFVKQALTSDAGVGAFTEKSGATEGITVLPWPQIDFEAFGPIERQPLSRIKKIAGANLHRNWVSIPHVTNNDEADITDLEALRVSVNKENAKTGIKVTMLAFLMKAVVAALKQYPVFNASLEGDTLVLKQYYHLGFAVDTPQGLVVPVIREVDKKGILHIAQEMAELVRKAQGGKLLPGEMQGGCFSISSLGGIGGTHFTPIINAPEVAILGLSRAQYKAVWDGKQFAPRLQLPLSLSYDHRVIDGATAARFNTYLSTLLADFRRIAL